MCSRALFGPKMAVFGPKLQFLKLGSATCESRSRPPPSSFSLKLCVIVLHTHRYHPPKFHPNLKHHDGVVILAHFARAACLLLACLLLACLLAAKPGRSTLDTKKGYKTKTGSTSSVTLTLTCWYTGRKRRSTVCYPGMGDRIDQPLVCLWKTSVSHASEYEESDSEQEAHVRRQPEHSARAGSPQWNYWAVVVACTPIV